MLSLGIRVPPVLILKLKITSAWTISHKKSNKIDNVTHIIVILMYSLSKKFWTNISMINVYPIRLKKWFLWNIIKSSRPRRIAVIKNTIFSDQLSSVAEGAIAKIWLVLAHPKSTPPLFAYILLDEARLALDSEIALDSGIWERLNGCVRILWSLTYESRSAWSYSLSAGLL